MEEWKEYKLEETTDFIAGYAFKSKDFGSYENKVVKIKDIQPPFVSIASIDGVNIHEYDISKLAKYLVYKNDFLLAMTGATIGKIGRYIYDKPVYLNQRVLKFMPKVGFDSDFIYYSLISDSFQKFIINHIDSDSAQPNISANTIGKYRLYIPDITIQKKISHVLKVLDSKIELNRRINDNLEQQAQALFKSWFVDFEPFKNGKFVESEMGMIPEGWKVGKFSELVEIKYGKDHKSLAPGHIPVYGSGGFMRFAEKSIYNKESVLIPRKGSLNNILYVNHPFWTVDTMFYTIMKEDGLAKFVYLFIKPFDLLSMNSGSAVPSMTADILNNIKLVIPPKSVFIEFENLIKPLFIKQGQIKGEIDKISLLRDTMLPRLMSGELKINDLNC